MEVKIVPNFKNSSLILVLVSCQSSKESRDIKCLHSLFEYCRSYRTLASKSITTASEDL